MSSPVVLCADRLVGLVVKASASRAENTGFESGFSDSSHTWRYRVSAWIVGSVSVSSDWVRLKV